MRIPVTYLILILIVISTILGLRSNINKINDEAYRVATIQEQKCIDSYQASVKKITDLSFSTKRGMQFLKNGDSQKATAMLTQAASLDQNYRDAWFYSGYAYLEDLKKRQSLLSDAQQQELLAKAKTALTQAQKIDPLYADTYKLLAIISENQKDDKEKSLWYARYETVSGKKITDTELIKNK